MSPRAMVSIMIFPSIPLDRSGGCINLEEKEKYEMAMMKIGRIGPPLVSPAAAPADVPAASAAPAATPVPPPAPAGDAGADPRLLAPREAAAVMGINHKVLERWRAIGAGPRYIQLTRRTVRYRLEDIAAHIERCTVADPAAAAAAR